MNDLVLYRVLLVSCPSWVKWPEHQAPSSAEFKKGGAISHLLHTLSWRGA
jgi:hypothetical protein